RPGTPRRRTTGVPRRRPRGALIVIVVSSAVTAVGAIGAPSGPMRRTTSGETGSLKVKVNVAGGSGITAPSAGTALTSEACAHASLAGASAISRALKRAPKPATPHAFIGRDQGLGRSFSAGAGSG